MSGRSKQAAIVAALALALLAVAWTARPLAPDSSNSSRPRPAVGDASVTGARPPSDNVQTLATGGPARGHAGAPDTDAPRRPVTAPPVPAPRPSAVPSDGSHPRLDTSAPATDPPAEASANDPLAGAAPDDEPTGFRDRAGLGDDFAAAINRELFPLASECIDLAVARNPAVAGLLAVHVQVIPIDDGRALVSSIAARPDNEIDDPDLFECIEQSSFAVEGLPRPASFDITMPIGPSDEGNE